MIRYTLKCPDGHTFDSWFQNAQAFDTLVAAKLVSCPECGTTEVAKGLMSPQVRPARDKAAAPAPSAPAPPAPPPPPQTEQQPDIASLKARVEAECDYVGGGFAKEARAIHDGKAAERPIYGEANPDEALSLIEDGIQVAPLPFIPTRKTN